MALAGPAGQAADIDIRIDGPIVDTTLPSGSGMTWRDGRYFVAFEADQRVNIEALAIADDSAYFFNRGNAGRNLPAHNASPGPTRRWRPRWSRSCWRTPTGALLSDNDDGNSAFFGLTLTLRPTSRP